MSGSNALVASTDYINTDIFTTSSFYLPILGLSSARSFSSVDTPVQLAVRAAATLSNLGCNANLNTYTGANVATLTLRKNAANTSVSVNCAGAGTGWLTDSVDTASFSAGDLANLDFSANSGGPDFKATIFQTQFNSPVPSILYGAYNVTGSTWSISVGNSYSPIFGYAASSSVAENSTSQSRAQAAGVLSNLTVGVTAVSGMLTAAFRTGAANGNEGITAITTGVFNDSTDSDSVSAGSLIDTATTSTISATLSFITYNFAGATSQQDFGCTNDATGQVITSGSTAYYWLAGWLGNTNPTATQAESEHVAPYAFTASALRISISALTEAGTCYFQVNGSNSALSVPVSGTGWSIDPTDTKSVSAGQSFNGAYVQGSGGSNSLNAIVVAMDDGSYTGASTARHRLIND